MGILGPALLVARVYPRGLGVTVLSGLSGLFMLLISPQFGITFLVITWSISLFFNRGVFVLINEGAQVRDREGELNYSESRSWGSASFLVAMYGLGVVVENYGISWAMTIGVVMLLLLAVVGLQIKERPREESLKSIKNFLKESFNRWHLIFYLSLTLVWASHGPAYTYMSLHLVNLGWTPSEIAVSWNIAVLTEILVFLIFKEIQKFLSLGILMTITQIAAVVRWTILAVTSDPILITLSQFLHGLTFGLCFVASQKLLIENIGQDYRKPAFAIYFAVTLGFGSLLGKLVAGWATRSDTFTGDFHQIFFLGTYLAVASLVIWSLRNVLRASETNLFPTNSR